MRGKDTKPEHEIKLLKADKHALNLYIEGCERHIKRLEQQLKECQEKNTQ